VTVILPRDRTKLFYFKTGFLQPGLGFFGFARLKYRIELGDDLEGVDDVDDIGFAACPSTIGVEGDGTAFADEAPADNVGLFAVTAAGEALGVAGRGAGLADLIQVGEERKYGMTVAALVNEGFATAEGRMGGMEETED
jgi:hypothetical protein